MLLVAASLVLSAWAVSASAAPACDDDCNPGTIPEPATLLLLAGGAGAAGLARWLRKRK